MRPPTELALSFNGLSIPPTCSHHSRNVVTNWKLQQLIGIGFGFAAAPKLPPDDRRSPIFQEAAFARAHVKDIAAVAGARRMA